MSSPMDIYTDNAAVYESSLGAVQSRIRLISFFRLLVFCTLAAVVYFAVRQFQSIHLYGIGLLTVLFVLLIRVSFTLGSRKQLLQELLWLNRNELNVLEGKRNAFAAEPPFDARAMHTGDLDVFGEGSIYQLINRASTLHGKTALGDLLNHPLGKAAQIIEQQQAVRALSSQHLIQQQIAAYGRLTKEEGRWEEIDQWLNSPNKMQLKWLQLLLYFLPAAALAALVYYLATDAKGPLALAVLLNWLLVGIFFSHTHRQHLLTGRKQSMLQQYASILKIFQLTEPCGSDKLTRLRTQAGEAHREIEVLARLTGMLDQRLNMLINFIGNSFVLYDLHCIIALEKWKTKNKDRFPQWLQTVGEIETLNSLAVFAFNHPAYHYPTPEDGKPFIRAIHLGHPLIRSSEQVTNDVTMGDPEKLLLVTGSNMSGKSTFLRTVGLNVLLAQVGAPVCAAGFSFSPMNILSSIRITDSLQEHTSYFMAELKRLHEIVNILQNGEPAMVLIDEVLRGTNSEDKTYGSEMLIRKLLQYNCLALFATHDLSLCVLEEELKSQLANFCFESMIKDGQLSFDYRLHRGVATNKNASFLMRKMGIIG